jgi:hypothetical protein
MKVPMGILFIGSEYPVLMGAFSLVLIISPGFSPSYKVFSWHVYKDRTGAKIYDSRPV